MRRYIGQLYLKIKKLDRNVASIGGCNLDWSSDSQYQVTCTSGTFVVDLHARTCASRRWDLTGIPCNHVCAVILDKMNYPSDFVDYWYKVETYLRCYENIINPINGGKLWTEIEGFIIKSPTWRVKQKGQRQIKKRPGLEEEFIGHGQSKSYVNRKGQVTVTCSVCDLEGHNNQYHLRPDASENDLFNVELEQMPKQEENPVHRISHPCAVDGMSSGPSISMPTDVAASVIIEKVNVSSMVDELQQLDAQEVTIERAERARRRKMRNVTGARISTT
ncbi:Uncharacterized protein Adt_20985 [Abeliophyllum distichum]|uniref:Zinc finger PMZ-type domain-containing protein n=1 Tax=Abeliophyllum distichum TaxID=126358 RepID=A0ABD1SY50_9LAMI